MARVWKRDKNNQGHQLILSLVYTQSKSSSNWESTVSLVSWKINNESIVSVTLQHMYRLL